MIPERTGVSALQGGEVTSPRDLSLAYLEFFHSLLTSIDVDAVCRVVAMLGVARDAGRTVFIAGNGGSSSTATHLANDLGKAAKASGRTPFRVLSLSDNTSWLTALANDEGYDRVFTGQLENFAGPGDVLIAISASGHSSNLVSAVSFARERGLHTVGLLGFDGGVLAGMVDEALLVKTPSGLYGPVETAHVLLCDMIATCLIQDRRHDG